MYLRIIFIIFTLVYQMNTLHALPSQCPKLDPDILTLHKNEFPIKKKSGYELTLEGYGWKVIDAKNLESSLTIPANESPFIYSASRPGVTSTVTSETLKNTLRCSYDFKLQDKVVAQVTLKTAHEYKRWQDVPNDATKALEKEEENLPQHFRMRSE